MILVYSSLGGLRPDLQQFGSVCAQNLVYSSLGLFVPRIWFTAVWIGLWPFIAGDRHP
jgi:hypothetical protein